MIQIFESVEALSKAAADIFVQSAQEAVHNQGRFTVALTGGSSPEQVYNLLTQNPYRDLIPWDKTYIFWGDERWVPLTDKRSNAKMAQDTLLNLVPIPKDQVYPMWAEGDPEVFANTYEDLLQTHFNSEIPQFDLILLGMGDDGHTASLFPGTAVLHEQTRWVAAYYLEPQSMYRITLTAPCINQAKKIVFLTFGEKKAPALFEVLEGEKNPEKYPAQLIQPKHGETLWLVDKKAASHLQKRV